MSLEEKFGEAGMLKEFEQICGSCELYNSLGCANKRGKILCYVRDRIIKYMSENGVEPPHNWQTEVVKHEN